MNLHPYSYSEINHPYERHRLGGISNSDRVYRHISSGDILVYRAPEVFRPAFEYRPLNNYPTFNSFSSGPQFLRGPGDRI